MLARTILDLIFLKLESLVNLIHLRLLAWYKVQGTFVWLQPQGVCLMPVGDPRQHPHRSPGAAAVAAAMGVMCRIRLAQQNWSQCCAL